MPFPNLPNLLLSDQVTCIRNTWGAGAAGLRTITKSEVIGEFSAIVEPDTKGSRGEGTAEGFDHALERYTNFTKWRVTFQAPDIPPGGHKPGDTILWNDESNTGHVMTVINYWPLGNQSNLWYAKVEERT